MPRVKSAAFSTRDSVKPDVSGNPADTGAVEPRDLTERVLVGLPAVRALRSHDSPSIVTQAGSREIP